MKPRRPGSILGDGVDAAVAGLQTAIPSRLAMLKGPNQFDLDQKWEADTSR